MTSTIETYQEITLDLNADVAEWCPSPHYTDILAAGTYQLNEETQTREGILYIYSLCRNNNADDTNTDSSSTVVTSTLYSLQLATKHTLPGIFDLSWSPSSSTPLLTAALADGSIRLFNIITNDNTLADNTNNTTRTSIQEMAHSGALDNNEMALYVDQTTQAHDSIISSYSSGYIRQHTITPSGSLICQNTWQAHDLEAWTACFNAWNPSIIYTGGDDCAFKAWDLRIDHSHSDAESSYERSPSWVNRKSHTAGVCCISCSPFHEHVICTGSYDECVRMWDCRMETKPVVECDVGVGGGAWRLKWHPRRPGVILAACMHAGFAILEYSHTSNTTDTHSINVVERYPHQQSLAYGAGWCYSESLVSSCGNSIVATCSFYDRLLHCWSPRSVC